MTSWPKLFAQWRDDSNRAEAYATLEEARRFVAQPRPERWTWLTEALQGEDVLRRAFVAWVFERQPVPKALLGPMVKAAIASDVSTCRLFLRPLLGSFGREVVRAELDRHELSAE